MELVQYIEKIIEEVQPDIIITHHPYDLNNDHYHTSKACQAAARLYQRKPCKALKGLYFMDTKIIKLSKMTIIRKLSIKLIRKKTKMKNQSPNLMISSGI